MRIELRINGEERILEVSPLRRLLDVLREDLQLTGAKEGCGEGECGACTVLLDGAPVLSCLLPVAQAEGHEITTVEGLARAETLSPMQRHLLDAGGVQCGACTPGLVINATAALAREPQADRARWRELLAGNLCRCTGWQKVIDAAEAAGEESGR
jgi:aerobic carbon-monoxide dehydrogenase small subunit